MEQKDPFKEAIHESAETLALAIIEETPQEQGLLSPQARKNKIVQEIEHEIEEVQKKLETGAKACLQAIQGHKDEKKIIEELRTGFEKIDTVEKLTEAGQKLFDDVTWKEQLGFSNECMQVLYEGAKKTFEQKDYDNAEKAFLFLATIDPKEYAFWVGLGHASAKIKHNDQCIDAYAMASMLQSDNSWPHIWAGNVFALENDTIKAKLAYEEALNIETEKNSDQDLINAIREKLQRVHG